MVGHGAKFGHKKEAAIAALLSHKTLEEAARAAGIGYNTLARWMKEPEFQRTYREARRNAFCKSIERLQEASGAAVSTVLKIMLDGNLPAGVRLRAAEVVLSQAAKLVEIEEIRTRLSDLERALVPAERGGKKPAVVSWPNKTIEAPRLPPAHVSG